MVMMQPLLKTNNDWFEVKQECFTKDMDVTSAFKRRNHFLCIKKQQQYYISRLCFITVVASLLSG